MVETAAYCLEAGAERVTTFLRLLDAAVDAKDAALRGSIATLGSGDDARLFERDPQGFEQVPGSPFAYWVSESIRGIFRTTPGLGGRQCIVKQGLATADDYRFVRVWWEVHERDLGENWSAFAKGGAFSPFYADVFLTLDWRNRGATLKAKVIEEHGNAGKRIYNEEYYFRPGLTWPRRTDGLSFRAMPSGCIFADKGPAAFMMGNHGSELMSLSALLNSQPFGYLIAVQLARTELAQSYEVGIIQQTPIPSLSDSDQKILATLVRRAWSLKRSLDTTNETSHAFVLPDGLNQSVTGLNRAAIDAEFIAIQREIDDRSFALYGIGPEDRTTIESTSKSTSSPVSSDDPDDVDDEPEEPALAVPVLPLNSWLVGVAFGRFDPRLATRQRTVPSEPEPFDALPSRSPGMWPADEPNTVSLPAILVDDPGHDYDLAARVEAAAGLAGASTPADLRPWLSREFFPLHIKMYSKSRRKAPIYWQLATPSASYSVWLYLHAFNRDTFYRVQKDYVEPKLAHEQRRLESLRREHGESPSAADRKAVAALETLVDELRAFLDEVKRVTPLWNPDLDDGVVINFAPLWRLVPHHKPWQKELKATWEALGAGAYDWARLAMHLWPERVVPKCTADRSLAIAHGLEDEFWVKDFEGKWQPRRPRAAAVRHVTSVLRDAGLALTFQAIRAFWNAHYAGAADVVTDWWQRLEGGDDDIAPIAYDLWPQRIREKAATDRAVAEAHGLLSYYDAQQADHGVEAGASNTRRKRDATPPSVHTSAVPEMLRSFLSLPGDATVWKARWAAFDAGEFDATMELALRVRTEHVVNRGAEEVAVAEQHAFEHWFWIHDLGGVRQLGEPEEELKRAVESRSSPAVKAALKSLTEAPSLGGTAKRTRKGKTDA